jgi:hypothetical protein
MRLILIAIFTSTLPLVRLAEIDADIKRLEEEIIRLLGEVTA